MGINKNLWWTKLTKEAKFIKFSEIPSETTKVYKYYSDAEKQIEELMDYCKNIKRGPEVIEENIIDQPKRLTRAIEI